MSIKPELRYQLKPLIVVIITALFSMTLFSIYLAGTLRGNIDWFFLPAKMFGTPPALVAKGLTPLYTGANQTGWDGQFYYYMSNDLLGHADTIKHIDNPIYRYQRIGFPLTAFVVSKIFLQDWVSPKFFLFTYFGLVLLAAFVLAKLFQRYRGPPWLALFWSLSIGVNLTMFNGLPDGAAQAYFILAIYFYLDKKWFPYALFIAMSVLTREAYILFPAIIFIVHLVTDIVSNKNVVCLFKSKCKYIAFVIPGILYLAWHTYLTHHFQGSLSPKSMIGGLLSAWPLQAWVIYFYGYIKLYFTGVVSGIIPLTGQHGAPMISGSYLTQLVCLAWFALLVFWALLLSIVVIKKQYRNVTLLGILAGGLMFSVLQLFLGPIVMFDMTGYLKAANFVLIIIPLFYLLNNKPFPKVATFIFIIYFILGTVILYKRGSASPYPDVGIPKNHQSLVCFPHYHQKIIPLSALHDIKFYKNDFYRALWRKPKYYTMTVKVVNNSDQPIFSTTLGKGTFNLSYQIVNAKNQHIKLLYDGFRTPLIHTVAPGQSVTQKMYLRLPNHFPKHGKLVLSLVQEGCSWLYLRNPKLGTTIPYPSKSD